MDQGDEFDDDFLSDLLGDDLEALEQQAINSTQAVRFQHAPANQGNLQQYPSADSQHGYETVGLDDDDDEIIDTNQNVYQDLQAQGVVPSVHPTSTQHNTASTSVPGQQYPYSAGTAKPSLPAAFPALPHRPTSQAVQPKQVAVKSTTAASHPGNAGVDILALQAQVAELLKERERLEGSLSEAHKQVITKSGEIAIVRSRHSKLLREKDLQLDELRKEANAAKEVHRSELEQSRRQQEQQNTESRFADHDRIVDKARRRKQPAKHDEDVIVKRPAPVAAAKISTPRRIRHVSPGDGFSMDERSPVKPVSQGQQRTPRAADKKRKRLHESPVQPLPMNDDGIFMSVDDEPVHNLRPQTDHVVSEQASDERYGVLQRFLNRRIEVGKQRTLEVFATLKFPSDQNTLFSTLILDQIAKLRPESKAEGYTALLCGIIIGLWTQCLTEKYFEPVVYLCDLTSYMLRHDHEAIPAIMDDLVPLAQKIADINLIPRFKRSLRKPASDFGIESEYIDVTDCLELLVQLASYCRDKPELLERFWVLIRIDFLSMLLRSVMDVKDISLTCRLLGYGIRPDGFGPVLAESISQSTKNTFTKSKAEDHLIDRLSALLIENPRDPAGENPYTQIEIAEMRLEVLIVFECFTRNEYSANAFARHVSAVGRLVRCMNDQFHDAMELLYGWEHRLEVVNQATRLLYHFVYRFSDTIDINEKLGVIPGGAHKYLIILTRLAFSEGGIWGGEVDADVVDCAHELLEDHVNPEEGEALMAAFQSGHSRR